MNIDKILFPVDFSARCDAAAPHVKAMARLFDSTIYLLHVLEPPPYHTFETPSISETCWIEMGGRAHRALADMARVNFDGLTVTPVVRQGDAATEITAFAENRGIDLIMMPTHGRGRFRAALLGSVAAKVLHDSRCPVWTSAHPELYEPGSGAEVQSILCAVDFGPESRSLVRAAAALGAKTGAKVRLVHAVAGEENPVQRGMDDGFERFLKDSARISAGRLQQETATAFDLCMEAGKPSRVIAAVAEHHQAGLVIIGRGRIHGFAGQLRTGAYSIIRDSPCPVLSV